MARIMNTEAGGVDIQDGTYLAELRKLEDLELDGSRYGGGIRQGLKFYFDLPELMTEDGLPVELTAIATAEKLSPKTKLWSWVEALADTKLEQGQSVNLDALVGRRALAAVVNELGEDGTRWARIKSLVAQPKATVQKAPVANG
ncbi:MAG: hypothetical protein ACE5I2_07410 [Anaerolineae bacterium]